ncbi:MAG: molecular chaperone DnaK [Archangium gephyra]|uniref:Molecular chaperone DnaK n=1 Tax=Archangium gephyra TaxID=48 RepID=A0A2W5UAH2_9BACT|nr:MAG: molecular chaperone DnaK [Archangium gephyra]
MEPVIGIDLGTTYSAVATVEGGRPVVIPSRQGSRLTPSVVGFTALGDRVVGERAQMLGDEAPDRVAPATKRFIGKRWTQELSATARSVVPYPLIQGPSGEVRIKVAGRTMPITQVSAMLLGELKLDAEAHFGRPVQRCVITVPANFDDGQRQATREAARIAGLEVLRIVNEPTAAAIAYGLVNSVRGRVLVFDLGGGTFDVSILEMENGVFEVRATGGDPQLGGDDFDQCIVQWLVAQVPDLYREAVLKDRVSMQRLRYAAERAKRTLTDQTEAFLSATELGDHSEGNDGRFCQLDTALTRDFFESLAEPLSARCLETVRRTLDEAKLQPDDIEAVMLVGGMTRVPLVRKLVQQFFGRPAVSGLNPDEAVALGAAVHAAELSTRAGATTLIDVATHSLSVGVLGGTVRKLIPRNTPVPAVAKETFLPNRAGQTAAVIPVFQGESEWADECTRLGELVLGDLTVERRADVPIEVTFELSNEGTLAVRAVDTTTGIAEAIRIDARTTLQPQEVDKLSQEQADYAAQQQEKDKQQVLGAFPRVLDKAERLVRILEKSAEENPSPEADAVVGQVKALLAQGRIAVKLSDTTQMAEVTRLLESLVALA